MKNETTELLPCPFCGGTNIYVDGYDHAAGKRWRVMCLDCMATVDPGTIQQKYRAIEAWNRRAQPENARQHALQTGVCPMCEDCPDGCPVETPNDSRNRPENEALTLEQLREMVDSDECGVHIWVLKTVSRSVVSALTDVTCPDGVVAIWNANATENFKEKDYGQTWFAYRHKPEKEDSDA